MTKIDSSDAHGDASSPIANSVLHRVPALMGYIDSGLRYTFANEVYRDWLGQDPAAMIGRRVEDVVGNDIYPKLETFMREALAGRPVTYEQELVTQGRTRFLAGSYTPDRAADGTVSGFFVLVSDITERKKLELDLSESQSRFAGAFQHAAIGMALVAPEGRFLKVNPALTRMLGFDEAGLLATDFQRLTHSDDLQADLDAVALLLNGKSRTYEMEKRYIHRAGHVVHAILNVTLVRDQKDRPRYFVSQIQDVTARKVAEDRLFREHELAEVTLRSIGDAVITTDVDGNVALLNPVAETLTGWSSVDANGRALQEIFPVFSVVDGHRAQNPMAKALRNRRVVNLEANTELRRRDGTALAVEDSAAPIHDRHGNVVGGVLVFRDVTAQRAAADKMAHLAHHDPLTGLPNRARLRDRLDQALAQARRTGGRVAVLICDLDRFKAVNDTAGHAAGDDLLKEVAKRLGQTLRDSDTVCRWAGDEFAILLTNVDDVAAASSAAQRAIACVGAEAALDGTKTALQICMSVGIAMFPDDGHDHESLIAAADTALYAVKRSGRNGFRFYQPAMQATVRERALMESILRQAIRERSFVLMYQPRVDLGSGIVVGVEALVRLLHDGTVVPPARFIEVAEQAGMIGAIGDWVIDEACRQLAAWMGTDLERLRVSVNVSAVEIKQDGYAHRVLAAMERHGVEPGRLELELTEGVLIGLDEVAIETLETLRHSGVALSLDDFGTGYSSLGYLRRLPIDILKIDRSFVQDIDRGDTAIVGAVIAMARSLGKRVVAEGIETGAQLSWLKRAGCDEGQGFYFAPAVGADDLSRTIAERSLAAPKLAKILSFFGTRKTKA